MKLAKLHSQGFTLITSLLLLMLLSGIALGLLLMVNAENRVGGSDMQNDFAYHAAEGGIEKMASDLDIALKNAQATTAAEICAVGGVPAFGGSAANEPSIPGIVWKDYQVTTGPLGSACPTSMPKLANNFTPISAEPNAGLYAMVIPISMQSTAAMMGGQEVSMIRSAQIALIPVFQYGVFSEGDLSFFSTPDLDFNGRVHTNADLYLGVAAGHTLTFHHKLEAYGNVVGKYIPNGLPADTSTTNDTGTVYIPTNDPGCTPNTSTSCTTKATNGGSSPYGDGSVTGIGGNPPQSTYIPASGTDTWTPFSATTTNHELVNGNYGNKAAKQAGTGARKLSMPFVDGTNFPYEIIRQPPAGEDPESSLSALREYNMASIRVLLADDPNDLPGGALDTTNNIRLANIPANSSGNGASYPYGIATSTPATGTPTAAPVLPVLPTGSTYNTYFATASNAIPAGVCTSTNSATANQPTIVCPADWPYPPASWTSTINSPSPLLVPTGARLFPSTITLSRGVTVLPLARAASVLSSRRRSFPALRQRYHMVQTTMLHWQPLYLQTVRRPRHM